MYKFTVLVTTFLALFATGRAEYQSCEMALDSPLDPCQAACKLKQLGILNAGKFNSERLTEMLEETDASNAFSKSRKNLLKVAFNICQRATWRLKDLDDCTAASAMYTCVTVMLGPKAVHEKRVASSRNSY
ncbi:uncharacterized protein LOC143376871 [Andrena cerasifolii]|uniref:uncharacterized protein LOC143376871 n=1 Tax=Andrena cerasifolii TaxID=2819439 RepID=UPI004037FBCE